MSPDDAIWMPLLTVIGVGLLPALAILALIWWVRRNNRAIPSRPDLWQGRDYCCPSCGTTMIQGWVLLGRGAIWHDLARGRPGTFAHIGQALPNTISLRLRPAANMAWRCPHCQLLLIDHDKLVY